MKHISEILRDLGWDLKLRDLARRVQRNVPDHRRPEDFHSEKSEIVSELTEMSRGQSL